MQRKGRIALLQRCLPPLRYPHYIVDIEGVDVHYQLFRSDDPDAVPLIFRCVSSAGSVPSSQLTTAPSATAGLVCV